jgi:WD40 repeat protein
MIYLQLKSLIAVVAAAVTISAADHESVSYYRQIVPIFKEHCNGCHHPGKMKGDLDLSTHAAILKGGKHGAVVKSGESKSSPLVDEISGNEPSMPKDGEPLTQEQVALIEQWITQGANDDTPADKKNPYKLAAPPKYQAAPVISSLALSPDGNTLAVAGYHEVLLHKADGSQLIGRLVGESPKVESLAFSSDGKLLAVSGGAPAVFGEVQVWDLAEKKQLGAYRVAPDSAYGISFSPDNSRVAFGAADKSVRILNVSDGKELLKFDNHSDWVFRTVFTLDGKKVLSGSRDRAMKLINAENGQFIDDINKLIEPILCFSRHPKLDQIAYGGELGNARIYKISDNQQRTAANNDNNLIKEFERQTGPVYSIAYSTDGEQVAIGSVGPEVRIYQASDAKKIGSLKGHEGAVFSILWHPTEKRIYTAGYDGKVRLFDSSSWELSSEFIPVPIENSSQVASARAE